MAVEDLMKGVPWGRGQKTKPLPLDAYRAKAKAPLSEADELRLKIVRSAATKRGLDEVARISRDWFLAAWQEWDSMRDPASLRAVAEMWRLMKGR